jgi:hypothetical protein
LLLLLDFCELSVAYLTQLKMGCLSMTNLSEIEAAAQTLSPAQKQKLLLFLAASLRSDRRQSPEPRLFVREQVAAWIEEDEADMKSFREGT